MDETEAKKIAHRFLCERIELEYCSGPPPGLYNFNPADELLFSFSLFGTSSIGSSEYVSISRATGEVRYLGHRGE